MTLLSNADSLADENARSLGARIDARNGPSRSHQFDVIFVLPHMGRGGAQRVTSLVANAWAKKGKKIGIVTWDGRQEEAHLLDPAIERIDVSNFEEFASRLEGGQRALFKLRQGLRLAERNVRDLWPWRRYRAKARRLSADEGSIYEPSLLSYWGGRLAKSSISAIAPRKKSGTRSLRDLAREFFPRLVLGHHRLQIFRQVFSEIRAPVVLSLLTKTNLLVLAATRGMDVRVVISERNDPDLQRIPYGLAALREISYRDADAVTSNSAGVLKKLAAFVPEEKLKLLPNPIMVSAVSNDVRPRRQQFVTVARLVPQKGIDLLLSAFAQIAREVQDWSLQIVGDGPLGDTLQEQAERLGIGRRVTFHGYVPDPGEILRSSRIFVLPSRFEGMPNALLEAMACNLAPIVTDASPGPLESVRHEENGLVVPTENVSALAEAMRLLAADRDLAERLGQQAGDYIREHDWSVVERQWLEVLAVDAGEEAKYSMSWRAAHS